MFEVIGVIALTLVAIVLIVWLIGFPVVGLGFGGPTLGNWAWMIFGLACSGIIVLGWWEFVGTKIHMSFG